MEPHPAKFEIGWPLLAGRYDPVFRRMWNYYLLCFAGAFRARRMQLFQAVFSKGGVPGGWKVRT